MAPHARWKKPELLILLCSAAIMGVGGAWFLFGESTGESRRFMSSEIERTGNSDYVWLFMSYRPSDPLPVTYEEVPFRALLPAFLLSELQAVIQISLTISLPFVFLFAVAWLLAKLLEHGICAKGRPPALN